MVACHQSLREASSNNNIIIVILTINNNNNNNNNNNINIIMIMITIMIMIIITVTVTHPLDGGLPPVLAPLDLHLGPLDQPVRRLPRKMIRMYL